MDLRHLCGMFSSAVKRLDKIFLKSIFMVVVRTLCCFVEQITAGRPIQTRCRRCVAVRWLGCLVNLPRIHLTLSDVACRPPVSSKSCVRIC